jgi:hypothetical protein
MRLALTLLVHRLIGEMIVLVTGRPRGRPVVGMPLRFATSRARVRRSVRQCGLRHSKYRASRGIDGGL